MVPMSSWSLGLSIDMWFVKFGHRLIECHASPYGGHFSRERTAHKILQSGFYWPTLFRDCAEWVKLCDRCQKIGNISSRNEIPLKGIMVVQIFDDGG